MGGERAEAWIFDVDNHYYEPEDAFTRYADPRLRHRRVRWAVVDGRRWLLVGGRINSYIAIARRNALELLGISLA